MVIVVGKNQLLVWIESCEGVADSLGECVELEITIHLVAKKIRDDDDARLELPDGAGQRRLVDLEEPEVAAWLRRPVRFRDERGRHPAVEVGSLAVLYRISSVVLVHVGDHPRADGI